MNLKELLKTKLYNAGTLLGISLLTLGANAQTNVTVDAGAEWAGAVIVFDNTPEQPYLWFSEWGVADLKTDLDATANTVTLYPNYNTYGTGDDPTYWTDGENGNKIMLALTLRNDDAMLGQQFTFSGDVTSYTLASGYTAKAFVKVLDVDYNQIVEITEDITEAGNFTIACNAASYANAGHIQYGFQIRGLNANPTTMAANGNVVITAGDPVDPGTDATVTVDASAAWVGYANVFENADEEIYLWGSEWGPADIRSDFNTDNNQVTLYPNYNTYGTGDDPTYWTNGEFGNKIFEGNTYVQDDALAGQSITFTGLCVSNSLSEDYTGVAFIKLFNADYSGLQYFPVPLVAGETFTVNATPTAGMHVQYGFSVTGLNGNPDHIDQNGNAVVTAATAGITAHTALKTVVYPNPASNVLNIYTQNTIDSVQIYNMLGQKVMETQPNTSNAAVNVSGLTNGMYIVTTLSNGKESSTRFIKQ